MRRALLLGLVLAVLPAADAGACSCVAYDLREAVEDGSRFVAGRVVAKRLVEDGATAPRTFRYTLRVRRAYNFDAPRRIRFRSTEGEASCGVTFRKGRRIAFMVRGARPYEVGLCDTVDRHELRRAARGESARPARACRDER